MKLTRQLIRLIISMQAISAIVIHEGEAKPGLIKAKLGIGKAKLAAAKVPHVIAKVAVAKEVKTKTKIALAKTAAAVSVFIFHFRLFITVDSINHLSNFHEIFR